MCSTKFECRTDSTQLCCSRPCARRRDNRLRPKAQARLCPCGKEIPAAPYHETRYAHNRSYCSPECRATYGKKRQKDPANYSTQDCQTCGQPFTRYRKYGNGALKFCSNECAAKHTKTKKHYILRDSDVVLDSSWEALFWGLCCYLKVPINRVDRKHAVEYAPGHWYAPDFLVISGRFVEVKGLEDDDDPAKWEAWRQQRGPLDIVGQAMMDRLRRCEDGEQALGILSGRL